MVTHTAVPGCYGNTLLYLVAMVTHTAVSGCYGNTLLYLIAMVTYPGLSSDCLLTQLYLVAMVTAMARFLEAAMGSAALMANIPAYVNFAFWGATNDPSSSTCKSRVRGSRRKLLSTLISKWPQMCRHFTATFFTF